MVRLYSTCIVPILLYGVETWASFAAEWAKLQSFHIKKVNERIAVSGIQSHSYGTSLAIWDHTVLPATRHKRTRPAFTPASRPVLDLLTPEGWKAELT